MGLAMMDFGFGLRVLNLLVDGWLDGWDGMGWDPSQTTTTTRAPSGAKNI